MRSRRAARRHLPRACCWSIPGRCSTSAAGSPPRRSGAPRASAAGPTRALGPELRLAHARLVGRRHAGDRADHRLGARARSRRSAIAAQLRRHPDRGGRGARRAGEPAALPGRARRSPRPFAAGAGLMLHLLELVAAARRGGARRSPAARAGQLAAPRSRGLAGAGVGPLGHGRRATRWREAAPAGRLGASRRCCGSALVRAPLLGAADGGPGLDVTFSGRRAGRRGRAPHARPATGCWWMPGPRARARTRGAASWRRSSSGRAPGRWRSRSSPTPTPITSAACPAVMARLRTGLVIEPGARRGRPAVHRVSRAARRRRRAVAPGARGRAVRARRRPRSRCCIPTPGWARLGRGRQRGLARAAGRVRRLPGALRGRRRLPRRSRRWRGRLRRVDLLKVGHHGSRGSTGDDWLDALAPDGGGDLAGPERLRAPGAGHARAAPRPTASRCTGPIARARSRWSPTAGA